MSEKVESRETVGTAVKESNNDSSNALSDDQVAALAYSYWEARGYQGGSPEEDWFRAKRELHERESQGDFSENQ
jgi:hypothetical protein